MKKLIPFAVAAAFTLGACASDSGAGSSPSMSEADAKAAVMAAESELKAAKAKGAEWRDTGKLIKEANEAIKAKRQSINALAQAEAQKNAGPHY